MLEHIGPAEFLLYEIFELKSIFTIFSFFILETATAIAVIRDDKIMHS